MATSIGELNLKISGNAEPVLGTLDKLRAATASVSKDLPKISAAGLKRAMPGLAGDIGGKLTESFGGGLLGGLALGGGIGGLIQGAIGLLSSGLSALGESISDLFSGEGTRLFNEELKKSGEYMANLGRNTGTTKDILDSVQKKSSQFADDFQRITDLSNSTRSIERVNIASNGLSVNITREQITGMEALNRLQQEANDLRRAGEFIGGRTGADAMAQARQQSELIQRARIRDARIEAANAGSPFGDMNDTQRLSRNLAIASARQQFANPTGGDELARQAIDDAAMLARTVGMTADEAARYRLEQAGATVELRNQLREVQRIGEGRRLTEEFSDPLEKFRKETANIEALLKEGRISGDTAALATDRALQALGGGPAPELKGSAAMLAGSQEALSAISRFQLNGLRPARRSPEEILEAANRQREEQLRLGRESREELRRLRERPPVTITEARI